MRIKYEELGDILFLKDKSVGPGSCGRSLQYASQTRLVIFGRGKDT